MIFSKRLEILQNTCFKLNSKGRGFSALINNEFSPLDLRNGGRSQGDCNAVSDRAHMLGGCGQRVVVPVWVEGLAGSPDEGRGEREDRGKGRRPRVSVRAEGSRLDCLLLMATQMAFMALIYRALIVVESG